MTVDNICFKILEDKQASEFRFKAKRITISNSKYHINLYNVLKATEKNPVPIVYTNWIIKVDNLKISGSVQMGYEGKIYLYQVSDILQKILKENKDKSGIFPSQYVTFIEEVLKELN